MALVIEFICDLPNGVHARPASPSKRCAILFVFGRMVKYPHGRAREREKRAGDYRHQYLEGDRCELIVSGEDEEQAFAALSAFIRDEFPHCDAPLPTAEQMDVQPVPESLSRLNPTLFHALPVCAGSAGGRLTHLKSLDLRDLGALPAAGAIEQEQAALDKGLTLLVKNIEFRLLDNDGTASAIWKRIAPGHRRLPAPAPAGRAAERPELRRSGGR